MQRIKQASLSFAMLVTAAAVLTVAPVFAHQGRGGDDSEDDIKTTQTEDNQKSQTTETPSGKSAENALSNSGRGKSAENRARTKAEDRNKTETEHGVENETEHANKAEDHHDRTELKRLGQAEVLALQANRGARSENEIQKTCEQRKSRLDTRSAKMITVAQNRYARISDVLTKASVYGDTRSSDDALANKLSAANDARAAATTSLQNLVALKPTIDCTDVSNAAEVATFKTALATTRADLKAYKAAVKQYVLALKNTAGVQ
jgi:hypothetical protein